MENYNNRDKILYLLYKNYNNWISGEDISNELGVTRTAVWKNINILKDSGYIIESSNKLGHKFISSNNIFDEFGIRENLSAGIFGQKEIVIYQSTGSTNIEAFKLASSGAPEGTIVLAEEQVAGKGRLGRTWRSPSGKNIYLSIISRPSIPPYFASRLTIVTAVALSDTLVESGVTGHRIKWPNDILYEDKKISGILTEMKGDTDSIDFIITGIGINVNSSPEDYPDELKSIVTSIKMIKNETIDRTALLKSFLNNYELYYTRFLDGGFKDILNIWKERAGIIGRKISVSQFNETFAGKVIDLNDDGNLILETDHGIRTINSGDINYI